MGHPHRALPARFVVIAIALTAALARAGFVSAQVPLEVLHEFGGPADGRYPGGLVQGTDGNFYGTTQTSPSSMGTVFRMTPDGTVAVLHAFGSGEGSPPFSTLIQASEETSMGPRTTVVPPASARSSR